MDYVTDDKWKPLVDFHGHMCPGLAVGARAVAIGLRELAGGSPPQPMRVVESVLCSQCGETVMRTRSVQTEHGIRCIPCADR